ATRPAARAGACPSPGRRARHGRPPAVRGCGNPRWGDATSGRYAGVTDAERLRTRVRPMKTTPPIALTATIVACTAATASARPAEEPPGSQASQPPAATSASLAAHREQISNEQWQRSQTQPAPAPPADPVAPEAGFPIVLVLLGIAVPLGLAFLVGR